MERPGPSSAVSKSKGEDGTDSNVTNNGNDQNVPPGQRNVTPPQQRAAAKRGGTGRNGTKDKHSDAQYKKQKLEYQQETIDLLREKTQAMSQIADSQAMALTHNMAEKCFLIAERLGNVRDMAFFQGKMDQAMGITRDVHGAAEV